MERASHSNSIFFKIFKFFYMFNNNVFFYMKTLFILTIVLFLIIEAFFIPFWGCTSKEYNLVRHYLLQRFLFKTKYTYSEILEFKNEGILEKKIGPLFYKK